MALAFLSIGALAQSSLDRPPASSNAASLGSTDFRPTSEQPVGWRGDGSGKYPGATPPLRWGRSLKQLGEFRCAAAVPKDQSAAAGAGAGGVPATLGFFTEWLVAGPVKCEDPIKAIKEELLPGEASFAPIEGDKLGDAIWQKITVEDSFIDLFRVLGKMNQDQAGYAQACLYVEKPTKIWFHFVHGRGVGIWLNGKAIQMIPETPAGAADCGPTISLALEKGWNRFLFKLTPRVAKAEDFPPTCYVRCRFWPVEEPRDFVENNIAWIAPMPGTTQAMPIIVGDMIFTTAHPYNLVCVEKKTGKLLWVRPNSPYDAATAEERKAKPEVFAQMDALAAKRDAFYTDFVAGKWPTAKAVYEETSLEAELDKLMLQVDEKYTRPKEQGEPDWWTIPTPVSDGQRVYTFVERGVSACYDLDGKRQWIRYEQPKHQHHGFFGSPVMADKKFVILDGTVTALSAADGAVKWSVDLEKMKSWRIWFGSLSRFSLAGTDYVLCPGGNIVMRASDGKVFGSQGYGNFDATPVFSDGLAWQSLGAALAVNPIEPAPDGGVTVKPAKAITWKEPEQNLLGLNFYQGHWLEASPLIHDGLAYFVTGNGVLMVFDAATQALVYRQELPLDLFQAERGRYYCGASPTLAGSYIYLMGSTGVTIIIRPGRKYEEVARNRIQLLSQASFVVDGSLRGTYKGRTLGNYGYFVWNPQYCPEYQECTMTSTPIFEGKRMYFRGQENLYCIEEK